MIGIGDRDWGFEFGIWDLGLGLGLILEIGDWDKDWRLGF